MQDRHRQHVESARYFEQRSLKQGSVGWLLLVSLGVSYTISGDFSGWNYGIAHGGWFGLTVAWLLMGVMYLCTVFGLAELSSALPTAGGGYGFARCALGRAAGFATGLALLVEYVCAPAAVAVFISNYINASSAFSSVPAIVIIVCVYALFAGIHIVGVGEALKLMFVITAIALTALIAFVAGSLPAFDASNLFDIPVDGSVASSPLLPFGISGLIASLPFGIWFFLGVEGVPLAAEEATQPKRDIPRALIASLAILACSGFGVLLLVAGVMGAHAAGISDAPLIDALSHAGKAKLASLLNWAGLAGLVASFFSIMYAGSRQMFALSRAGYLPKFLALTGRRKTPVAALVAMSLVGIGLVLVLRDGQAILDAAVFGACVSYALMNLSHMVLRLRAPRMPRAYRTPGGACTTALGFALSCVAIVSTFFVDIGAALGALAAVAAGLAYYALHSRRHLVANAPEEEFAQIQAAQSQLRS